MPRHTNAIIELDNIRHNYELCVSLAPESNNMAIIKADAYGHGLIDVARYLSSHVPAFGIAIIDEAVQLRQEGITNDLLVLQGCNRKEDILQASLQNIWLTIHSLEQLYLVLKTSLPNKIKIWLKLDTGMHRLGLNQQQFNQALSLIKDSTNIDKNFVISSHFSCAAELHHSETRRQFKQFKLMIEESGFEGELIRSHSNSSAIVGFPEANMEWNRPGIMLFGLPLFDQPHDSDLRLRPAMTFESEVTAIRDVEAGEYAGYGQNWVADKKTKIATVAVGYADGYPRHAKSGTPVLIRNQRAYLIGTVSMDLITVDITGIDNVKIGERVELWGNELSANEIAKFAGTIGYDLLSGLSPRVPRIYRN